MLADIALAAVALAAIGLASYLAYQIVGAKNGERDALVREANQIGNQKIAALQIEQANAAVAEAKAIIAARDAKIEQLEKGLDDEADKPVADADGIDKLRSVVSAPTSEGAVPGVPASSAGGDPRK